jgi:indolepyruvate ferredoxin oxidoreductase beta subunit
MTTPAERPITLLIAALGGEGGGVLADWLVDASTEAGYPAQSTSIPGVSQRTGATTYYIEIFPVKADDLAGRRPVLALTPSPGNVDVMVASELVEAGRAMQSGYVSRERTTLVASTHRVFAVAEKVVPGDGRYDGERIVAAARTLARRCLLFDLSRLARQTGSVINAVLFGAVAGCGVLPLSREQCEAAIRRSGKAVEASLRGFAAGHDCTTGTKTLPAEQTVATAGPVPPVEQVDREFPPSTHAVLETALARLTDYQDADYARLYLDRLRPILAAEARGAGAGGYALTNETARQVAVWMTYEDVIRVADLKSRRRRLAHIRDEAGAAPERPVIVVDYFKPGVDELADLLPPALANRLRARAEARGQTGGSHAGVRLKSNSVLGFLLLRAASRLKGWRRHSARYAEEQALIERWLAAIRRHAGQDAQAALEVARCARLVKGYSDTRRRGRASLDAILRLAEGEPTGAALAEHLRRAREAALGDAEGKTLAAMPGPGGTGGAGAVKAQAVVWMPRRPKTGTGGESSPTSSR